MKLIPLKLEEQAAHGGASHVAVITHADLTETTVNTAQVIPIASLEANKMGVRCVDYVLQTPFQDASDAAFNTNTAEVGDGGDADRLLVSAEMNVNGTEISLKGGTTVFWVPTADDTVDLTVGSMAAKALSDIDTGEVHIYLDIRDVRGERAI